jgi:hypothetical protein
LNALFGKSETELPYESLSIRGSTPRAYLGKKFLDDVTVNIGKPTVDSVITED